MNMPKFLHFFNKAGVVAALYQEKSCVGFILPASEVLHEF